MRNRAGLATYLVILACSLALLAAVFLPLWKPLFLAVVIAGALASWQRALTRKLRGRRRIAAIALVIGLVLVVVLPLAAVVTFAVKEAIDGAQWLSAQVQSQGLHGLVNLAPESVQPHLRTWLESQQGGALQKLPAQGVAAVAAVGDALSRTGNLAFETAMMLIALFFLLTDGARLVRWVADVSPLGADQTLELMGELRSTSASVLVSTVATAAVQAGVAAIGFWIAGVPHVLFFAALTFFAAFIPSVGTAIIILPLTVFLALTHHWGGAIFLGAWGLFVAGTVDNVLKPYLARSGTEVHGGLVFFAMIGGIVLFGALGLILGPVALSLLLTLVRQSRRPAPAPDRVPLPPPRPPQGTAPTQHA